MTEGAAMSRGQQPKTQQARDGEITAGCNRAAPWSSRGMADTDAHEVSHRTLILET